MRQAGEGAGHGVRASTDVWGHVRGRPGMQGPVGVGRGGVGVYRVSQGMNAGCGCGVDMSGCMGMRRVGCVQGVSGARTWAGVRVERGGVQVCGGRAKAPILGSWPRGGCYLETGRCAWLLLQSLGSPRCGANGLPNVAGELGCRGARQGLPEAHPRFADGAQRCGTESGPG